MAVAFLIGTIEILGLLPSELNWTGPVWRWFENFSINTAGFIIVGPFVITSAFALAIWHFGRIEDRWDAAAIRAQAERRVDT